jgi:membrane dipeptidase
MNLPVFDGHNDILLRLFQDRDRKRLLWPMGDGSGHLDLPRMRDAGFAGGMFAIFVPSPTMGDPSAMQARMDRPPYAIQMPDPVPLDLAQPVALAMAADLLWMARASDGALRLCRSAAEIESARQAGVIAALMHMEGAEAIDEGCDALHLFHAAGLRSLGLVWSRPNLFGHGVPFAFPASPDTGPGLTDAGMRLVKACNDLKVLIDLSHLNEAGFWDVARLSSAPLVATHSNAHAVTASSRNLTDRQLLAIRDSGGLVGLNFATVFLRRDGRRSADMGWDDLLRHIDHLIAVLGEDHVGFGSDFDGATVPDVIGDVRGLPVLLARLAEAGLDRPLLAKLAWGNWLAVLRRTLGG